MAEFKEVLRQFKRMCDSTEIKCRSCGLGDMCMLSDFVKNPEEAERRIMKWAVENPEPVYPTWAEWLEQFGLVTDTVNGKCGNFMYTLASQPIPQEIAQKYGIEPKKEM